MNTEIDRGALVRMLHDYAELIDRDCQRRFAELDQAGTDLASKQERLAALDAIIADYEGIAAIEEMRRALEEEGVGAVRRVAGARH
jgi:hypothetical protein